MDNRSFRLWLFATGVIVLTISWLSVRLTSATPPAALWSLKPDADILAQPPIPEKGAYIGVYLDDAAAQNCRAIHEFTAQTSKAHVIYSRYIRINDGEGWWDGTPTSIADFMRCVKDAAGVPALILEFARPLTVNGLPEGDANWLKELIAPEIRAFGEPMFIIFAPEMNLIENKGQGHLTLSTYQAAYRAAFVCAQ